MPDGFDAGIGVRQASATDGGLCFVGAEADRAGPRRSRSHDADPAGKQPRAPKKRQVSRLPDKGPVHVLIDSTGLQIYSAGQWLEEKHGVKSRRNWRKLHLVLDADSGDIIAQVMTDQDASDASQVEALLDQFDTRLDNSRQMAPMTAIRPMSSSPGIAPTRRSLFRHAPMR
jgi:hypothetical protein